MFEEDDMEPTPEFKKKTDEAEAKLAPAVDKSKKPKIGPSTSSSPKPTVTVGTVRTYTNKEAAREAIAHDKEKKEKKEKEKSD